MLTALSPESIVGGYIRFRSSRIVGRPRVVDDASTALPPMYRAGEVWRVQGLIVSTDTGSEVLLTWLTSGGDYIFAPWSFVSVDADLLNPIA